MHKMTVHRSTEAREKFCEEVAPSGISLPRKMTCYTREVSCNPTLFQVSVKRTCLIRRESVWPEGK